MKCEACALPMMALDAGRWACTNEACDRFHVVTLEPVFHVLTTSAPLRLIEQGSRVVWCLAAVRGSELAAMEEQERLTASGRFTAVRVARRRVEEIEACRREGGR